MAVDRPTPDPLWDIPGALRDELVVDLRQLEERARTLSGAVARGELDPTTGRVAIAALVVPDGCGGVWRLLPDEQLGVATLLHVDPDGTADGNGQMVLRDGAAAPAAEPDSGWVWWKAVVVAVFCLLVGAAMWAFAAAGSLG